MNKKNILILVFLIITGVTACVQYINTFPAPLVAPISKISIQQTVFIDGKTKTKKEFVMTDSTALQVLTIAHTIKTNGVGKNAFIISIDGREALAAKNEFWALYINGKQATVGAGSYIVKNNDTIEWKIETY